VLKKYEELRASNTITKKKSEDSVIHHKKFKQTTLSEATGFGTAVNLDNLIVNFVIETMSPLSIVESRSFEQLRGYTYLNGRKKAFFKKFFSL